MHIQSGKLNKEATLVWSLKFEVWRWLAETLAFDVMACDPWGITKQDSTIIITLIIMPPWSVSDCEWKCYHASFSSLEHIFYIMQKVLLIIMGEVHFQVHWWRIYQCNSALGEFTEFLTRTGVTIWWPWTSFWDFAPNLEDKIKFKGKSFIILFTIASKEATFNPLKVWIT